MRAHRAAAPQPNLTWSLPSSETTKPPGWLANQLEAPLPMASSHSSLQRCMRMHHLVMAGGAPWVRTLELRQQARRRGGDGVRCAPRAEEVGEGHVEGVRGASRLGLGSQRGRPLPPQQSQLAVQLVRGADDVVDVLLEGGRARKLAEALWVGDVLAHAPWAEEVGSGQGKSSSMVCSEPLLAVRARVCASGPQGNGCDCDCPYA